MDTVTFIAKYRRMGDYFNGDHEYPISGFTVDALHETNLIDLKEAIKNHWDEEFNDPNDYDFYKVETVVTKVEET